MAGTNITNIVPYELGTQLTVKQQRWLESYLTCFNMTQAARDAGYKSAKDQTLASVGSQNFRKLQNYINDWLDNVGLSDERIKTKITEGFEAKETKLNVIGGEIVETEIPALAIQAKYVDMSAKVKGIYAAEKHEHGFDDGLMGLVAEKINEKPKDDA